MKLTQKERTDIARVAVEEEIDRDFDLGFLSNLTPEEKYKRMADFVHKLPSKYYSDLFGDVEFFSSKKKELGPRKLIKLSNNLRELLEKPEFRDIWNNETSNADTNEIVKALGRFVKNKPGRKIK